MGDVTRQLDLGIITLSRTTEYVERLLAYMPAALRQQASKLATRHVVVNNANSVELTKAALKGGALALEPGYNTTFSQGNNMAAKALPTAEWLLLLNDDVVPEPGFVQRMWDRSEGCDVLGALLVHTDSTVNHAGTIVRPRMTDHLGRGAPREEWEEPDAVHCASVTFAAVLIRRSTWDELGGLDEAYQYGWEDTDFCMNVLEWGGTIKCARDAVALHDECGTRPKGGANDVANYELFTKRWEHQIIQLLGDYQRRIGCRLEG